MSYRSFIANVRRDPAYFGRRLRWEAWKLLPEREVRTRSLHGEITFSSRDQIIGRALYLTRQFAYSDIERSFQKLASAGYLKKNGNPLLLDIGANIGTTLIPLLLQNRFERAIAFEPNAKNLRLLRENVRRNGLEDRVKIREGALSDARGEGDLLLSETNFGDHRVAPSDRGSSGPQKSARIQLFTLDEILTEEKVSPTDVSLIWMDTQGHESKILAGAERVLRSARIPVVTEFWPEGLENAGTPVHGFCERVSKLYPHFIDLQEPGEKTRSSTEIAALAEDLRRDRSYTDLILIP